MANLVVGTSEYGTFGLTMSYGKRVWIAHVNLLEDVELSPMTSAVLYVNDVPFVGTIVKGTSNVGRSEYVVVGGAGALRMKTSPTALRSDGGVRLATLLGHLFASINNTGRARGASTLEAFNLVSPDRIVGRAWAVASDSGANILDVTITEPWFVDRFGVVQIGARAARTVDANSVLISKFIPSLDRATIVPIGDVETALFFDSIGATLVGGQIESGITIGSVSAVETDVLRLHLST